MTPQLSRALCLAALAALLVPSALDLLLAQPPVWPAWMLIPPGAKAAILLLAPACLTAGAHAQVARVLAALGLALALLMLLAGAAVALRGSEVPRGSMIDPLRTTTLTASGVAALAASLYWRVPLRTRVDASALLGMAACALFFLLLIAHLYGAVTLTLDDPAHSTGLSALLLLGIALAALSAHDGSPMLAYLGDDTGAMAKRRLLPAAVLMPLAAGFLLLYAINGGGLSPASAVALTVFANVALMLLLVDHAGNKVSAVTQEKEERWQARAQAAKKQGTKDALTGLLNRQGWDHAVSHAQHRCKAEKIEACVVMIDLDGLKRVNDTQGHAAGDELIRAAAKALRSAARRSDALARLGGDEFAYLTIGGDVIHAAGLAARFEQALNQARVAGSVGYALSDRGQIDEAIKAADAAMYERKRARKLRRA